MGNNNVLDFKAISNKKLQEQFELQDCDTELLELVSKLVSCNPGRMKDKKKEASKSELLAGIREQKRQISAGIELSDDELDSAAGGILAHEPPVKKPPNGENQ